MYDHEKGRSRGKFLFFSSFFHERAYVNFKKVSCLDPYFIKCTC